VASSTRSRPNFLLVPRGIIFQPVVLKSDDVVVAFHAREHSIREQCKSGNTNSVAKAGRINSAGDFAYNLFPFFGSEIVADSLRPEAINRKVLSTWLWTPPLPSAPRYSRQLYVLEKSTVWAGER